MRRVGLGHLALIAPALVLCAVYWTEVATHLGSYARFTYADADAAAGAVISDTFQSLGHEHAVLGNLAWYTTLWFGLLIRHLSFARELWIAVPYLLTLATAGLLVAGVARVAGARRALLAAVPVLCLSPTALWWSSSLVAHSTTWFGMALLGLYATTLTPDRAPRTRRRGLLLGGLVAVVAGTNAASDYLLVVCGIVPLALAALIVPRVAPGPAARAAARRGLGVAAAGAVVAGATLIAMRALHVQAGGKTHAPSLLDPSKLVGNVKVLWRGLLALVDVQHTRPGFQPGKVLRALCALAAIIALLGGVLAAARGVRAVAARRPGLGAFPPWVVFWSSGTVLLLCAYLVAGYPTVEPEFEAARYLVGLVYCAAALAPLALRTARIRGYAVAAAAVTVLALASAVVILRVGIREACCAELEGNHPTPALATRINAIARREGMTRGYGGYWYSLALTWFSHAELQMYPIDRCGSRLQLLCPSFYNNISSWYRPRHARRSFFLVSEPRYVRSAKSFGPRRRLYRLGNGLTMYVYDYDIATRIGPR